MSKLLPATCENGVVTIEGKEVESTILSQGKAASSGAAILDKGSSTYIASNASDIADLITSLNDSLNKLVIILTSIGAGMTGPTTAPPPTLAADLAEITAIVVELETKKEMLK